MNFQFNKITVIYFLAFIPAVILHEISHGYVALKCGDTTARDQGRLSLNPLVHIDPIGTLVMPIILALAHAPIFGYAKPVPVNLSRLRNLRNQSFYVSLAGPITNFGLSAMAWVVSLISLQFHADPNSDWFLFILIFGLVNLSLAVFNLLPIPPLDGSALIERIIPRKHLGTYFHYRARALPFAFIFIIVLFRFTSVGSHVQNNLQQWWLNSLP